MLSENCTLNGSLLRIFISENNRHEGKPLYEWLAKEARQRGLAGVTVIRGMEGFGSHKELHTSKILDMSSNLPIMVYLVDTPEKIESFVDEIEAVIGEGLVTIEPLHMRAYKSGQRQY